MMYGEIASFFVEKGCEEGRRSKQTEGKEKGIYLCGHVGQAEKNNGRHRLTLPITIARLDE